ncbi:MAG: molecular chaperone DnaJ [Anaerolineae bacterium]
MASVKRDYYEILQIPRDADKDQVRSAYRKLARQYHPDVNKESDAEARFKELNEAYQVLSSEEKRALYDRYGHSAFQQGEMGGGAGGFGGFGDLNDIFEDFFGFGMRGASRPGPTRGADLRLDLQIEFEEAVFGAQKELQVSRMEACPTCGGSGAEPGTSPIRCSDCNGTGQIRRTQQSIFGSFVNVATCPRCGGRGEVITTPCSTCHGQQRVERPRKLSVDIPAGVDDDTRIRLSGEGEAGTYGGPAGSLYVVLHVKPHAYFRRRDTDILLNINLNIAQAALGGEITIPTLEGEEKLTIPEGTQTGALFRLKGKGVPRLQRSGRGDQVIVVNVVIPTDLDAQQKKLLADLGKTLGTDVTPHEDKGFLERIKEALGL